MRLWNEMMENDHPRGAGLLVGRQIRYLVQSDHGVLGGFAFSAAALHLRDRDRWIGWTLESRRDNLHWVVNMNRFLIRPDVHCKNLASHLMGKVVRQLPKDFEVRYGYRPLLLESFVDTQHYAGTCYQASNWLMIGKTQGRGRQDQLMVSPETIKDIYVIAPAPAMFQKWRPSGARTPRRRLLRLVFQEKLKPQYEFVEDLLGEIPSEWLRKRRSF